MYNDTFYQLELWADRMEDIFATTMIANSLTSLLGLATYILAALGLYYMAKRRGIAHAWLSWIPIGDLWILGSLSDQYRWVSRGENKSKRKTLLTLSFVSLGLTILVVILIVAAIVCVVQAAVYSANEDAMVMSTVGLAMGAVVVGLGIAGVSIALIVVRYMALYDVYMAANPENAVLFLVLSIFIRVTEGFFLFFNREKDNGMVRRQDNTGWNGSAQNCSQYYCTYRPNRSGEGSGCGQDSQYRPEEPNGPAGQDPWDRQ